MNMRAIINLTEWDDDEEDEELVPVKADLPALVYHGTGPATAAMIMVSGTIRAIEPVDDDGLGSVVCVTRSQKVARDFACEYARLNSPYDIGFVFALNGAAIGRNCEAFAHEAETASSNEEEFRIKADLPLRQYGRGISVVGNVAAFDDPDFRRRVYEDGCSDVYDFRRTFPSYRIFGAVLSRLLRKRNARTG